MTHFNFKWNHDSNTDTFRLYENDVMIVDNIKEPNFSLLMDDKPDGQYYYKVTSVNMYGESKPSPTVTRSLVRPKPPTNLQITVE